MNTHPNQRHRYGDWRDMTVEELRDWLHLQVRSWWRHVTLMELRVELRDWLHLQVRSWWRHVTLMDLYDDHRTALGHIA
jgi:hypothetical protein